MHTFDSLCRYPKRKNVSLSNPLTRIRRTRLSQGAGPRNPLAKNRILRSVNRIAALAGREGWGEGRWVAARPWVGNDSRRAPLPPTLSPHAAVECTLLIRSVDIRSGKT